MADQSLTFDMTFRDFQFLQTHMSKRVSAMNRPSHALALTGIVVCAVLITTAIVVVAESYSLSLLTGYGVRYPLSLYLLVALCLSCAIFSLLPAVRFKLSALRMQVSDDGPLLGATRLTVEDDGLRIDRAAMTSKFFWPAFKGVEITRDAIVLPVDNGIGIIVPSAAFATDTARLEFAAAISKHLTEVGQAKR
jgi:YcxB-like protein